MGAADHRLEVIETLGEIAVDASDTCFENDAGRLERGILDHIDELDLGKFAKDDGDPIAKMRVKAARHPQFRDIFPSHLSHRGFNQGFGPGDIVKPIDKLAQAIDDNTGKIPLDFEQALIQIAIFLEELPDGVDAGLHEAIFVTTPHFTLVGFIGFAKNPRAGGVGLGKQPVCLFHRRELGPRHDMRAGGELELELA
jgi:hypothetical protein